MKRAAISGKNALLAIGFTVLAAAGGIVHAADAQALASKHLCLSCHKVDVKSVGPAYKDVAAKYKGKASAMADLTKKVREGGKGTWGNVPMPAQKDIGDDELKTVLAWVLSQ